MRHVLREHVFQIDKAGQQRDRQQHKAQADQLEQQRFHGLQGRQRTDETARVVRAQVIVLDRQHHRLQRREGEQGVGQDRGDHVQAQCPTGVLAEQVQARVAHVHQHRQRGQREGDDRQVFHRLAHRRDQQQHRDHPQGQRADVEEAQVDAFAGVQLEIQHPGVQQHGHETHCQHQRARDARRLGVAEQAQADPQAGGQVEQGGRKDEIAHIHGDSIMA